MYIYKYINCAIDLCCLRVYSCAYLYAQIFWSKCKYFFFITVAVGQVKTWEKYPTELPVLVEKTTRHLHSCNLNPFGTLVL